MFPLLKFTSWIVFFLLLITFNISPISSTILLLVDTIQYAHYSQVWSFTSPYSHLKSFRCFHYLSMKFKFRPHTYILLDVPAQLNGAINISDENVSFIHRYPDFYLHNLLLVFCHSGLKMSSCSTLSCFKLIFCFLIFCSF